MPKELTNQVPMQILTVAGYLYNKYLRKYSAFTKGKYIVGEHTYTPEELELAYPTAHVKVVSKIYHHQPNRQK
jgi:hypothetical protein